MRMRAARRGVGWARRSGCGCALYGEVGCAMRCDVGCAGRFGGDAGEDGGLDGCKGL
jgi:hypothetical protein